MDRVETRNVWFTGLLFYWSEKGSFTSPSKRQRTFLTFPQTFGSMSERSTSTRTLGLIINSKRKKWRVSSKKWWLVVKSARLVNLLGPEIGTPQTWESAERKYPHTNFCNDKGRRCLVPPWNTPTSVVTSTPLYVFDVNRTVGWHLSPPSLRNYKTRKVHYKESA